MSTAAESRVEYLTPAELCRRYNNHLSTRTLANWRAGAGSGPAYIKIGGKILYPLDKVIEWERRHTFQSTSGYKAYSG
jgi:hypothetical protein